MVGGVEFGPAFIEGRVSALEVGGYIVDGIAVRWI